MSQAMKRLLTRFLQASEEETLKAFARLPKAQVDPAGAFVYIPGTRPDRVLLVGHADTVREHDPAQPGADVVWVGDVAMTKHNDLLGWCTNSGPSFALGADDRAGCAALYDLHDGTHSVLITTGEESGLRGAKRAAEVLKDELARHSFALEIDRRGCRQAVFYDISTKEFEEWILARLEEFDIEGMPWKKQHGSSSDVKAICPAVGICGVNLAAGYDDEHKADERLYLGAWERTRQAVRKILAMPELLRQVLPPPPPPKKTESYQGWPPRPYMYDPEDDASYWEGPRHGAAGGSIYAPQRATVGARRLVFGGKIVTLGASIGKQKAKRLLKLIDYWKTKGTITLDDALVAYAAICERAPEGSNLEPPLADLLAPRTFGKIVHCKHWCNTCVFHVWRHIRATGSICPVMPHHSCPKHVTDPLSPVFDFKFIGRLIDNDGTWSTEMPPMRPTGEATQHIHTYKPIDPCACGHSKVIHAHETGHCLMSSCGCGLWRKMGTT